MAVLYRTIGNCGIRPFLHAVYRADIQGEDRIPAAGPCILVANHESIADPFFLGLATSRIVRYMSKAELYSNAILRTLMNGFGTFPIERGRGDRDAMSHARRLLAAGEVLGIFPQGTSKPSPDRRWHRGAARLALETGVPLVPVCLVGTDRALPRTGFRLGLPKVRVLVASPIVVERTKPTIIAAQTLIKRVEETILELRGLPG